MKTVIVSTMMGDTLVAAGGVVELSRQLGEPVRYLCRREHLPTIASIFYYTDVIPVTLDEVAGTPEAGAILDGAGDFDDFIVVGHHQDHEHPLVPSKPWVEWVYECLGVEFRHRWDSDPVPQAVRNSKLEQLEWLPGVAFVHDDTERGFDIRMFPSAVKFRRTDYRHNLSLLSYAKALVEAPEVHVIDSAFFHLAESLQPKGKLYLHRYARHYIPGFHDGQFRHDWTILEDDAFARRSKLINMIYRL